MRSRQANASEISVGEPNERAVVEAGLRLLIQTHTSMRELFGKVDWDGDLDEVRQSRIPDAPFA